MAEEQSSNLISSNGGTTTDDELPDQFADEQLTNILDDDNGVVVDVQQARWTLLNFIIMSLAFSANHGCVVTCLSLATARLGATGAWQSGMLYLCYTGSAVLGATYVVKRVGARNSLVAGMALYCIYVGCFLVATIWDKVATPAALLGAAIGGVGAGFLWTAQGTYFALSAEQHAQQLNQAISVSNASLAGIFSFIYLSEEVVLRLLPTWLLSPTIGLSWSAVFCVYTIVAILSTIIMLFVHNYPASDEEDDCGSNNNTASVWYKVTVAWQLLRYDPKMKHMIGLNFVFGFTSAFLNSYVNGELVPTALDDPNSNDVGILAAWVSCVAAVMSLVFGKIAPTVGKGSILSLGALCFAGVVLPCIIVPNATAWGWSLLFMIYTFHGVGRATYEGTLKVAFADFFPYEKEGAFANIILQTGISGAVGYVLTFTLLCSNQGPYCVEYRDGTLHNVLAFEILVLVCACVAIVGYWRASALHDRSIAQQDETYRLS